MRTAISRPLEVHLLHRPLLIASPMDTHRIHAKGLWMLGCRNANAAKGIDVEMHQVVVCPRTWVMADNSEVHIFVDKGKQAAQVRLECFEGFVDVWLGDVFAVRLWVLEEEAVAVGARDVVGGDGGGVLGGGGNAGGTVACNGFVGLVGVGEEVVGCCGGGGQDVYRCREEEESDGNHCETVIELGGNEQKGFCD